ncbi:hypothetical protein CYLTODRAFT_427434 [Cylindrobasidium torrendii FP15055 ss-10]|uniref:Uncharacterized protein n=1 Tax=Cylindrobasidium torrendii FP15055 ss-10 TaxID=1314674 RepID=A0A0D7ATE0_9AGAR|nr:hypothetical protein CYLTODRAFT_427434 [Cylindrobasidium torrendii FP15055 ss-10]
MHTFSFATPTTAINSAYNIPSRNAVRSEILIGDEGLALHYFEPTPRNFWALGLLACSAHSRHILYLHFVSWNIHLTDRSQAMPILPSRSSAHHPRFSNTHGTLPRPQRRVTCAPTGEQFYGDQDAAIDFGTSSTAWLTLSLALDRINIA